METPLVSIVIVTWNRKADVLEAVRSIYDQVYRNIEVIVVDNCSTDGTAEALRDTYPGVSLIALERNTGASHGRSMGIAAASGAIVFTLDSDASLGQETLTNIVRKFQAEPTVGIISCKIVNAFTHELDAWIYSERDKADQNVEFLSYSFCSAGSAIRREVIERIGSFWDLLFIYREEDDLSLRAWNAGYKILFLPEAIVYHRVSPHRRVDSSKQLYFELRNSLFIYFVRYPWWMLLRFGSLKIATSLVRGVSTRCVPYILRALVDVVRQLPLLLKQRRPVSDDVAHFYLNLQRQHGPLRWDLVSWLKYKI